MGVDLWLVAMTVLGADKGGRGKEMVFVQALQWELWLS